MKLLRRRACEPVRAQQVERLGRRARPAASAETIAKRRLAQPLGALERPGRGRRIGLRVAGEGAQALAGQQVRVSRPVEQALVAVEPVPRRRFVASRYGIDEVERRLAADEIVRRRSGEFSITGKECFIG